MPDSPYPPIAKRIPIRVLLVDDHDLFRTGLRNLLEEQGLDVVGEARPAGRRSRLVREPAPDVVVMDLNMPGMSGVEATRQITEIAPLTRVIVLTISDQDSDVMDAIVAGACGYLLKDASIEELIAGIRAAAAGESLISPHIAGRCCSTCARRPRPPGGGDDPGRAVRPRARGAEADRERQGQRAIAAELFISPKTVKNHISNILMKLQIENRIQAAVYAVRSGIV